MFPLPFLGFAANQTPSVCCADSPLWDGALGRTGRFLAKAQSFRFRQRLPPRGSSQSRQALTEGVPTPKAATPHKEDT